MDCPQCTTPNPPGAHNCRNCRTPLGGSAETLVGELTPPAGKNGLLGYTPPVPPGNSINVTLDGGTMDVPTNWSVPASGRGSGRPHVLSTMPSNQVVVLGSRYEIIAILGEGGMGAVYKARDRELDRLVAVKVIRPELAGRPEILQRFKQELILARKVTHRNVIRIFDLGKRTASNLSPWSLSRDAILSPSSPKTANSPRIGRSKLFSKSAWRWKRRTAKAWCTAT